MEESTCDEMVIHLSQRLSSVLCLIFLHFFISLKYDFYDDAERMIVKMRKNVSMA